MPTRLGAVGVVLLVGLGLGVGLVPARGEGIHRHGFAGKQVVLARGEANVAADERAHDLSTSDFWSRPSSEHLSLTFGRADPTDAPFVHYQYDTPPAPVSPVLAAGVWVKATKPGVQLRGRIVFPKERDPARPESPLTMLVVGPSYQQPRRWEKLELTDAERLIGKHLPAVQTRIGRPVNTADAYLDRLVLNVYTGEGPVDVWVDDLAVGPVVAPPKGDRAEVPGVAAAGPRPPERTAGPLPGRAVEQRGGQLLVGGKPHFFRAIRHTGVPLHVLRRAGFDTLWLPPDAAPETIDEAGREGWLVIPAAPKADITAVAANTEEAVLTAFRRKFAPADVLFWSLGSGLTDEQERRVNFAAAEVRKGDRRRPLGGDLWDGFGAYSQYLDVVGAHRWPLFTSLGLAEYKDWLAQRKQLATNRPVFWTWVQNHLQDDLARVLADRPVNPGEGPPKPAVGPHPEQVRQLAYLSLAAGCRGLGFWSDAALSESAGGTGRLQGLALLNTELDLLSPVILSEEVTGTQPIPTGQPHVQGFLIAGKRGLLLLPIWLGPGDQFVPPQGAVNGLKVMVPLVPDGAEPWLVSPAGVESIRHKMTRVPGGVELVIDEFDLVTPVVFTADAELVAWWQNQARGYGKSVAQWAIDLTRIEYEKVRATNQRLMDAGVTVPGWQKLLVRAGELYKEAQIHWGNEQYDKAYKDATRALRPLRVLMRAHWERATARLDLPTASPYAVSFATLPEHYELAREVAGSRPGRSALPYGAFEPAGEVPAGGIAIDDLPGWGHRESTLPGDKVDWAAGVIRSTGLADPAVPKPRPKEPRTPFSPGREAVRPDDGYTPPAPELGKGVLRLEVRQQARVDRAGKPLPNTPPLERMFLAVDAPPVRLPPGTLVRVSGWVKVQTDPKTGLDITGTADGALLFDDAGGESLGVRVLNTRPAAGAGGVWKQYHLYRRVPASGSIAVTVALTGAGVVYFDDLRVEPLVPGAAEGRPSPPVATGGAVVPAGYQRPR